MSGDGQTASGARDYIAGLRGCVPGKRMNYVVTAAGRIDLDSMTDDEALFVARELHAIEAEADALRRGRLAELPDDVTSPPRFTGPRGRAWAVDLPAAYSRAGKSPSDGGDVASWLIEAPMTHPVWHSYWVFLAHLRPLADGRTAVIYLPGATHEIWLAALDPGQPRQAMLDTGVMQALTPLNFAAQMIMPDDAAAALRVQGAVEMVCAGTLSPDTDFRAQWIALFGDNMMRDRRLAAPDATAEG